MVVERVSVVRRVFEIASLRRPEQELSERHRLCSPLDRRLLALSRLQMRVGRLPVRPVVRVTQRPRANLFLTSKRRLSGTVGRRCDRRTLLASLGLGRGSGRRGVVDV